MSQSAECPGASVRPGSQPPRPCEARGSRALPVRSDVGWNARELQGSGATGSYPNMLGSQVRSTTTNRSFRSFLGIGKEPEEVVCGGRTKCRSAESEGLKRGRFEGTELAVLARSAAHATADPQTTEASTICVDKLCLACWKARVICRSRFAGCPQHASAAGADRYSTKQRPNIKSDLCAKCRSGGPWVRIAGRRISTCVAGAECVGGWRRSRDRG